MELAQKRSGRQISGLLFPSRLAMTKDHLGDSGGHHFKQPMVEVLVQGHIQHQGMLGVKLGSFVGVSRGGVAERHLLSLEQGFDECTPAGVMGAKAAHVQQFQPWFRVGSGGWVAKKGWGQAAHGHFQPLLHFVQQRGIEGEQHRIVWFSSAVLLQGSNWIGAVMQVAACKEPRSGPLADAPHSFGAARSRNGSVY